MAFDDDWDADREDVEYFDAAAAQGHLLIIRAFDAPKYYRTENNPDGMVHPGRGKDFEPFPNTVVRCAVADLDADEGHGKIYPESVLFPFSITKVAKMWVGKGPQLVMWRKTGKGQQTDPYELRNMRGDEQAVKAGTQFLDDHPEFMELKAPEPYDERPPSKDRDRDRSGHDSRNDYARDEYRRSRDDGWGDREPRATRRRDEGEWEYRRPARQEPRGYRDERDRPYDPRYDDRGRQERPASYRDDPWGRPEPRREAPRDRDDRDGSFLSRSRNHQGGFQDEEPPF